MKKIVEPEILRLIGFWVFISLISACSMQSTNELLSHATKTEAQLINPAIVSNAKPDNYGWTLKFQDLGETPWHDNWFLDGRVGKVTNTNKGIKLEAGLEVKNDAHHLVLWTKQEFSGDIKIEYDFTKIDDEHKMVNILFIQASGIGEFEPDITKWNHQRQVPSMKFYFERMKLLHISYAAYDQNNTQPENDYVRARVYPLHPTQGFKGMEVPPSYFKTGLFRKDVTYKITVVKTDGQLSFSVLEKGQPTSKEKVFTWALPERGQVEQGRIGLRQMFTRNSVYNNFRVYTKTAR
ncbi:DUF1961 family protein [Glaciecola sp. SC05]|uniref:DUF1961 family protein n=1 Tax=Glaciecola sp. SC05 TaxID=1987355 RepID=UPI00352713E3